MCWVHALLQPEGVVNWQLTHRPLGATTNLHIRDTAMHTVHAAIHKGWRSTLKQLSVELLSEGLVAQDPSPPSSYQPAQLPLLFSPNPDNTLGRQTTTPTTTLTPAQA